MNVREMGENEARLRRAELAHLSQAGLDESFSAAVRSVELSVGETTVAATSAQARTLVAEREGRLVGVLVALPEPDGASLFVLWIVVHPEYRRHGIGRALVLLLEQSAAAGAVHGLVNRDDAVAAAFWPAIGYHLPQRQSRRVRIHRQLTAESARTLSRPRAPTTPAPSRPHET